VLQSPSITSPDLLSPIGDQPHCLLRYWARRSTNLHVIVAGDLQYSRPIRRSCRRLTKSSSPKISTVTALSASPSSVDRGRHEIPSLPLVATVTAILIFIVVRASKPPPRADLTPSPRSPAPCRSLQTPPSVVDASRNLTGVFPILPEPSHSQSRRVPSGHSPSSPEPQRHLTAPAPAIAAVVGRRKP